MYVSVHIRALVDLRLSLSLWPISMSRRGCQPASWDYSKKQDGVESKKQEVVAKETRWSHVAARGEYRRSCCRFRCRARTELTRHTGPPFYARRSRLESIPVRASSTANRNAAFVFLIPRVPLLSPPLVHVGFYSFILSILHDIFYLHFLKYSMFTFTEV